MERIKLALFLFCWSVSLLASAQNSSDFTALETRLLAADELSLDFEVTAAGAVQASIAGTLEKNASGEVRLTAKGNFAGQYIDLVITRNQQSFQFGNRESPQSAEAPAELWKALMLGFTRMGILHNIANLSSGAMPDHAEGGVDEWVLVSNVKIVDASYIFDIVVDDIPSGSASLTTDEIGNPSKREQTVAFPGGEMRVVEMYSNVSLSE
ncbi:MAG: hypothetical protein ACI8XU_001727 [Kiritimatiellia bacterium]|jgi:hypothetical protein